LDKNEFIRACRDGGERIAGALRSLDRVYFAVLYRDCRRAIGDAEAARDLVQETFIKVWQRCGSFRGDSELLPWIRTILRRNILDRVRQARREIVLDEPQLSQLADAHHLEQAREPPGSPDSELQRGQLAECFQRCWTGFARAAPEHALVITWIAEDGLTNEDVAALLGRTPGATREFISQCRKKARVHLADWYAMAGA
jgi:RNA polymerase sigma-70 factor (ECF subfamily)